MCAVFGVLCHFSLKNYEKRERGTSLLRPFVYFCNTLIK